MKKNLIPLLLAGLQFIHIVDFMLVMPLSNELMKIFNITPSQFSIIVASYGIAAFFSSFFGSFLIDRFDRKKSLILIYIGFTIGTYLCGTADSYSMMVTARVITGIFGGMIQALIYTIIGDIFAVEKRSTAIGIVATSFSVAAALGVPMGLKLADLFGWNTAFKILAILGVGFLFGIIFILPKMTGHLQSKVDRKSPVQILRDLFTRRNQQIALSFMLMLVISQFMLIPFITPYMIRNVGLLQNQIFYIYLGGGLATFFTGPFFGRLADKVGRKKIFYINASLSVLPMLLITNFPPAPVYIVLLATIPFFIFITGRMIPAQSLMTSVVLPQNRGSFLSLNSSMQQLGMAASSFIAGSIIFVAPDGKLANYNLIGYIGVTLTILTILLSRKLITLETKS